MSGRIVFAMLIVAAVARPGLAQEAAAPRTLEAELSYLGAQIAELKESLPNIACIETVVSQELHGEKVHERVDFTATLEVKRGDDGKLGESFTIVTWKGKPFTGGRVRYPAYVEGGFDKAINYFSSKAQACYRYTLSPGRIDFESDPAKAKQDACNEGVRGFALLDGAGNVDHVERTVSGDFPKNAHLVPFAAIDFHPVELNGRTFRLASHTLAEFQRGSTVARFEATYERCRLFGVTVKIGPATEVAAPPPNL